MGLKRKCRHNDLVYEAQRIIDRQAAREKGDEDTKMFAKIEIIALAVSALSLGIVVGKLLLG